ncbi:MAG: UDP-N-acetylglucosamine--N-acetylmuramyl-(pentapeptide) pyrophosphoryl-undecaprenol N-acetylglucosamine transferase [Candidatus Theseobacter exili]|nr:UDP-N-acetylglucosamine--N-acetylmuramyl-(pentapeptide) pyrophosphoryl-undecaprenol N-acetylglucosamine transferase [Candidatus Theseobacter exili]
MKLVLISGKTGGHLYPACSVAEAWEKDSPDNDVVFFVTKSGYEKDILKKKGFKYYELPGRSRSGTKWRRVLISLFEIFASFKEARRLFKKIRPDVVLGFGSYISAGPSLAARSMGIAAIIHESNIVPGIANKYISFFARAVTVGFEPAKRMFSCKKTFITGVPVRKQPQGEEVRDFYRKYCLKDSLPIVLILGGSQGAKKINQVCLDTFSDAKSLNDKFQIIHVSGNDITQGEELNINNYKRILYLDDVPTAMAASQIYLGRAGASTLSELTCASLPAILVPFPYATESHQLENARFFEEKGAAVIIEEERLNKATVLFHIKQLIENEDLRKSMKMAMKSIARPDAAMNVVNIIKDQIIKNYRK